MLKSEYDPYYNLLIAIINSKLNLYYYADIVNEDNFYDWCMNCKWLDYIQSMSRLEFYNKARKKRRALLDAKSKKNIKES